MKYHQPYGVSDPTAPYVNGNPSTGTMGSIPPAASIEYPQREIVEMITDGGLTPDDADLKQLAKAIQGGRVNFAVDVGTVNNLQVTLAPIPVYRGGMVVRVLAVQSNTGPSVLNVNAIGPKKIRRPGDTDLLANDITAKSIVTLVYNEGLQGGVGAWELQGPSSGATGTGTGGYMTDNLHLYVNYNIGNDANDGTANDAAHALKQIQRAIDIAWTYRPSQYTLTIHVADSQNYTSVTTPMWSGPNLQIIGNQASPAGVLITASPTKHALVIGGNNIALIAGIKVTAPDGDPAVTQRQRVGFYVGTGAVVQLQNCETGYCEGYHIAAYGGDCSLYLSHRITGGCWGTVLSAAYGSTLTSFQTDFTITQPISVGAFVAAGFAMVQFNATYTHFINPGYVTGKKYQASVNAFIDSLGGGPSYFPGTLAGTVQTGGQYQ
jgi:hypothetical protein